MRPFQWCLENSPAQIELKIMLIFDVEANFLKRLGARDDCLKSIQCRFVDFPKLNKYKLAQIN